MNKELLAEILDGIYKIHIFPIEMQSGDTEAPALYQVWAETSKGELFPSTEIGKESSGSIFEKDELEQFLKLNMNHLHVQEAPKDIMDFMKELEPIANVYN